MDKWPDKFIIGLTGNIATGKSTVRKMLEHVGAFGIDADALSNRAIQQGAPGYQDVLDSFGRYILDKNKDIDRRRLGEIVFSNPAALRILEAIVHPLVREAVGMLVQKSKAKVVVIEAIKLLESPLRKYCDNIWVTTSDEEKQIERLKKNRGMDRATAKLRIAAQSPQIEKVAFADVVIHNNLSIESTWDQVKASWKILFPESEGETVPSRITRSTDSLADRNWSITRARPRQAKMIAQFMNTNGGIGEFSTGDVMDAFGEKAFLLLQSEEGIQAMLGWKVENLVARVDNIIWKKGGEAEDLFRYLSLEVEEASKELQCEIILLFVDSDNGKDTIWADLGYEIMEPENLNVAAWKEAALDSFGDNQVMFFKTLREKRILRPM